MSIGSPSGDESSNRTDKPDGSGSAKSSDTIESIEAEAIAEQYFSAHYGPEVGPFDQALAQNMTPAHVDRVFDFLVLRETNRSKEEVDRSKDETSRISLQSTVAIIAFLAVIGFILLFGWMAFFYGKSEIIVPVITGVGGVAAGAVGGYGYGKGSNKQKPHAE